jgi:hypothetical protein
MGVRRLRDDEELVQIGTARPMRPEEADPDTRRFTQMAGLQPGVMRPGMGTGPTATAREALGQVGRGAVGLGEAGLAMGTGAVAQPIAMASGVQEALREGPERLERTIEGVRRPQELLTFQPRTPAGQRVLETAALPFQFTEGAPEAAAAAFQQMGGGEGGAASMFLATEALPGFVGGTRAGMGRRGAAARRDVGRVRRGAEDLDIELGAGTTRQREQIVEAGRRMAPGDRGAAIPDVVTGMRAAQEQARQVRNQMYERAEATRAGIRTEAVQNEFVPVTQQIRRDFIVEEMPRANRLLAEVERINDLPPNSAVTLNAMERWHKKANRAAKGMRRDSDERMAIETAIRAKEDFLDAKFNSAMVSGDPTAIEAWRGARRANADYRRRFRDEKVIRDMVDIEATPETVRQWIFGTNAVGARKESAQFVQRIKQELGEDSPQFAALRADAAHDIMRPLFREGPDGGPDLRGFIRNYDEMVRRNRSLAEELFGENLEGLQNLRDIAQAHRGRPIAAAHELPGFSRIAAVGLFGHQLARGALRRAGAEAAINALGRQFEPGVQRRMIADILGYDANAPMFDVSAGVRAQAIIGTLEEEARRDPRGDEPVGLEAARQLDEEFRRRRMGP